MFVLAEGDAANRTDIHISRRFRFFTRRTPKDRWTFSYRAMAAPPEK
jgi:hypothetical protein